MDAPDEAGWCDFCKEPFRKKPALASIPAPAPESKAKPGPDDPAVQAALARVADELRKDSAGLAVPRAPSWFRPAAYAFTLGLLALTAVLVVMTISRARQMAPASQDQSGLPGVAMPVPKSP